MITIVDYGLGNVLAFVNLYKRLNVSSRVAKHARDLQGAAKIILPGVGAFDHAMERLDHSGMRETLDEIVSRRSALVLGICVGMQMLAAASEEGSRSGLGWIEGRVKKLAASTLSQPLHLPHMGWNDVKPVTDSKLFAGLAPEAKFYFLHSYYFHCARAKDVLAVADYGGEFSCAVHADNVYGVQFHPEKSHRSGIQLLKNFADL